MLRFLCRRSSSQIPQLQLLQIQHHPQEPHQKFSVFTSQSSNYPPTHYIIHSGLSAPKNHSLFLPHNNNNNKDFLLTFPCHRSIRNQSSLAVSKESNYSPTFYYNMSSKHLGTGSTCPPLKDDKLRIYSMRFCPYAQRAVLVLLAKDIPHDVVNINLKQKPEWIFLKNPQGKVPTIESKSGQILYESLIVADYLDDIYPNRPLQSKDPYQRALDRIWVENFSKVTTLFYKSIGNRSDPEEIKKNIQGIKEALVPFEQELARRGTTFFGGADLPGMLDYMIWPGENFRMHFRRDHGTEADRPEVCPTCGAGFLNEAMLKIHLLSHTDLRIIKCDEPSCKKMFTNPHNTIAHYKKEHGETPYVCPECAKQFESNSGLLTHRSLCHSNSSFQCHCCRVFKSLLERLPLLKLFFPDVYDFEDAKKNNPKLEQWRQSMKEDPAVKQFYLSPETHMKFVVGHLEGTPNYDLLEE